MEIAVKAKVSCAEGPWGCSTYVIIDPAAQRVTHLVLQAKGAPYIERLVPMQMVMEGIPGSIRLCCTRNDLTRMELFVEATCVEVNPYAYHLLLGQHLEDECLLYPCYVQFQHKRIPTGTVALCRSARVKVVNKIVGRVDRFVVDSADGHITHLVLRKGPPWRRKNVTVPVAQIESIGENTVHLKLDRISVEALPAIRVRGAEATAPRESVVGKSQLYQKKKHYVNGLETSEQIDQARLAKLVRDQDAEPGIELAVDRS